MKKADAKSTSLAPPTPSATDWRWQPLVAGYQGLLDLTGNNSRLADLHLERILGQELVICMHKSVATGEWAPVPAEKWGGEYKLEEGEVRYRYAKIEFQHVSGEFSIFWPEFQAAVRNIPALDIHGKGKPPRERPGRKPDIEVQRAVFDEYDRRRSDGERPTRDDMRMFAQGKFKKRAPTDLKTYGEWLKGHRASKGGN